MGLEFTGYWKIPRPDVYPAFLFQTPEVLKPPGSVFWEQHVAGTVKCFLIPHDYPQVYSTIFTPETGIIEYRNFIGVFS
jgi:hypothetical protein